MRRGRSKGTIIPHPGQKNPLISMGYTKRIQRFGVKPQMVSMGNLGPFLFMIMVQLSHTFFQISSILNLVTADSWPV